MVRINYDKQRASCGCAFYLKNETLLKRYGWYAVIDSVIIPGHITIEREIVKMGKSYFPIAVFPDCYPGWRKKS